MPAIEPALPADIAATLEQVLSDRGGLGEVHAAALRRLVGDHCDKFVALDRRGRPRAFVVLSPPGHPRAVASAAERAYQARDRLGDTLGGSVLTPLHVGESGGASYSITTYCEPIGRNRWVARWQRWRLAPSVLRWLSAVVEQTAAAADPRQIDCLFARPLHRLASHPAVDEDVRAAARRAGEALRSGAWRPRTVLAHNDFWIGNLVRRPDRPRGAAPFFVIDWAGSLTEGHAVYDLVRMTMSLDLSPRQLRPLLAGHCRALGCEPEAAAHYLVSALGHLCENLGAWPIEQFARTASVCHRFLESAR